MSDESNVPATRPSLVGRAAECAMLDKIATDVLDGFSGSLVFIGEPGVGKTRLLQYMADAATDVSILWIVGAQSELRLGFAALHRLVLPYLDRLDRLTGPHRNALEVTFGLTGGPPPSRFLVSLAALALLSDVAAEHPVVCLIDDAQWLDQESLNVLGFIARRLYADPIAMVFSAREHAGDLTPLDGMPTRRIEALDPASSHAILDEAVSGPLDPRVSARVIDETGGNPLAMLELLGELTAEQLAGRFPLPRRLPVGRRVDVHFLAQVATLSPEARTLLLVAAACADEKPSTVWRAGALLGVAAAAANHAVQQGIMSLEPRIAFRHPLIRSAVYDGATPEERQHVHNALATVAHRDGDDDQAAWHRAAAVTTPDEAIAADLQASAERAQRRGGYTMQAAFLTRAAELSPDARGAALRYLAAAQAYLAAGDGRLAEALLDLAIPGLDDAGRDVAVLRLRAAISVFFSRHRDAPAVLLDAATRVEPADVSQIRQILFDAMQAAIVARQYTVGTTLDEVARRVLGAGRDPRRPPSGNDLLLDGFATRIARGYADAVPLLRAAVAMMFTDETVAHVDIPSTILGWFAADDVWDEQGRRAMFERAQEMERRAGALGAMRITLAGLSTCQVWAGEMKDAENSYGEAAEISALIGVPPPATTGVLLEVRAWQGRESESRAVASSTADWGRQKGAAVLEIFALMGLTILELGLGRYPEALGWALQIFHDDPPGFGNRVLPEVVEAGVRGGDRAAAEAALARLTERATASATPWALGVLARSRALMAGDADAEMFYLEAIEQLTGTAVRTELARAHLLYGEWLRRRKRRRDAEVQLRTAYDMFTAMGATAFAGRTGAERRAAGQATADAPRAHDPFGLTPQEAQVARQASTGATNAEIASRLFVTTSTVEYHLSKVFRKLGVTSRRQLASILSGDGRPGRL
ncbi:helix-turn-helix transcriptional regulator [Mycolicibacterium arseniciresistens]|uniref:LuxR C-terminal-related transcriptional regulator n=1 Tax=Mycolicibacterium arseniciresistens TaxID=3062257 RepID=A0ABT8UBF3_9MYCO|nr:LuxR family transcriptional regulator [Mycolicibacterium arseniciresistens]MDO3635122.1 LuxR C-terminal-related transcriptional regulator [Mycolicibacterium arseniciresistens]